MAANFPTKTLSDAGDTFTSNGTTFVWDGTTWKRPSTPGVKGTGGTKGEKGQKGEKGVKGEKGEKGEKGVKGEANATTINNNADNRVITGSDTTNELNAEADLTYDGTKLKLIDDKRLHFGTNNDLKISHTNDLSGQNDSNGDSILDGGDWASYIQEAGTGPLIFKSDGGPSTGAFQFYDTSWRPILKLFSGTSARAALYHTGTEKLITDAGGISITGGIKDKDGDLGSAGQVLASTGTQLNWVSTSNIDGAVVINNNADDRVITGSNTTGELNAESNLTFSSAGVLGVTGSLIVDQVNINDNIVQLNGGSNPLKIRGQGTGGSQHLTLDDDVTIVGDAEFDAGIKDKDGDLGSSGQVLSSTGTQVNWVENTAGQKGEQGASVKGQKGEVGTTTKGEKGATGADNSTKGQKGEVGEKGATGADNSTKGAKGEVGTTVKGQKGEVGEKGSAAGNAGTVTVRTDSGSAYHQLVFVDSSTDNQQQVLKMDDDQRLQWNPNSELLAAQNVACNMIATWSGVDTGNAGEVLTSGGSGSAWSWESVSSLAGGVPSGGIIIWNGAANAIPTGWLLCDGTSGTPDLTSKFVIGAKGSGSYQPGYTGGYTDVFIPEHTHTYSGSVVANGSHNHSVKASHTTHSDNDATGYPSLDGESSAYRTHLDSNNWNTAPNNSGGGHWMNSNGSHAHTYSGTTANNTGGAAITNAQRSGRNLPPYYALCYIMKT